MVEHNPPASADRSRTPVIPLPIALYVSGELIFELYDGGQPSRRFSIRWERSFQGRRASQRQQLRTSKRFCAHTQISARVP